MEQHSKDLYFIVLAEELSENYDMSYEDAFKLVQSSFVPKMLIDDEDAIYMMHESPEGMAWEIICEYLDRGMSTGVLQKDQIISGVLALIKNEASVEWICDNLRMLSKEVIEAVYLTYVLLTNNKKEE